MAHLQSERIRLRAAEKADIPLFLSWINDEEVTEHLFFTMPFSQFEEEQWYDSMMQNPVSEHALVIEVEDPDSEGNFLAIGTCQFRNVDWRNRSAELGILIGEKSYWNQGYGTETMRLLLKHGFNTQNFHRIWLQVIERNRRGIRAYEKAGFSYEGKFRQAHYQNGCYYDLHLMSVLKPEWEQKIPQNDKD
jgi:diamine N-acetyltransferase